MLPAFPVELKPYDPNWANAAEHEAERLHTALGEVLVGVHHIGSTSIPGQLAKPILDLVPVVRSHVTLEAAQGRLEALGYVGRGEFGLAGRRYFVLDAADRRLVQLHCYEEGNPAIARHLAFRDYLRLRADLVAEYEALKRHCVELHRESSQAYSLCKGDWIRRIEAEALAALG